MKTILLAALLAPGALFAQTTATTTPVGYETLALSPGLNFASIRLHEAPVASGQLESATANSVTDNDINLSALITSGTTYILELGNGSGIIQEITTAGAGTSITTPSNLSGLTYPISYKLRKSATLASVFGDTSANLKLDRGAGGPAGADQVWVFTSGTFAKYYFDDFGGALEEPGWYNIATNEAVNPSAINLVYADSFIISSNAGRDVVVSGEVKLQSTELNLQPGFNFVSSVAPTGVTLADAFGTTVAQVKTATGLNIGGGSSAGADQIWLFNGSGFTKIYFDEFGGALEEPGWYNVNDGSPIANNTELAGGYIISAATGGNVISKNPTNYSTL